MTNQLFEITEKNFDTDILQADKPVMIDFWAPWCTQCKALTPLVEELAGAYGDKILFAQCNLTENTPIAVKYGIRSIPTFLFLKKGQVIEQLYGMISKNQFEKVLKTLTENP